MEGFTGIHVRRLRPPVLGAWLWLGCFQFFVAEQIARWRWRGEGSGGYSMTRNYISDLGALPCTANACSPLHWLMNTSFVLQGLLIFGGAVLLRCLLPRSLWRLFAFAGAGVLLVGLVPEGQAFPLHLVGAGAHFFGGNLAMILLGSMMLRRPAPWKGAVTLLAGALGMIGTVAIALSFTPLWAGLGWAPGVLERLAAYPLPLWLTWTGLRLLREFRSPVLTG